MTRTFALAGGKRVTLVRGDITRQPVDVMVNAANAALAGGGGVDGAIHRAGGPELMNDLNRIRPALEGGRLSPGDAVATTAGHLPARIVLHTAGPVYHDGRSGEPEHLSRCYRTCLALAEQQGFASISFPAISTGVYGYPVEEAARIATSEALQMLSSSTSLQSVLFVVFSSADFQVYEEELAGKV